MANRCAGCTNKFKFREKPSICPECHRTFCQLCLPVSRSKKEVQQLDTCVYCSRRQKQLMQTQEAEVMDTFQERYYKRTHQEPPIQTKVQLNMSRGTGSSSPLSQHKPGPPLLLSEEDKRLEERLRKLKESHKQPAPSYSADQMAARLSELRGDEPQKPEDAAPHSDASSNSPALPASGSRQVDPTHNLIEQAAREVKMDQRLDDTNQRRDKDMADRLDLLKGRKPNSDQPASSSQQFDAEMHDLLEGMEIEIPAEDDPEQLLMELLRCQPREEAAALREAESSQVQDLVEKARNLARDEGGAPAITNTNEPDAVYVTPYPVLESGEAGDTSTQSEASKLLAEARDDIELDKQRQSEDEAFMKAASDTFAGLRESSKEKADDDDGTVVRSKLDPSGALGACKPKNLDFTWVHFGEDSSPGAAVASRPGPSAARELGFTGSGAFASGSDDDVEEAAQQLLKRMMAEAALDEKLEDIGYVEPRKKTESKDAGSTKPEGSSVGAAAAVGYWGGGGGGGGEGEEDLPWCCICNNDATIRCHDCDGDLYCTQCFSEGHQQFGLYDHRYGAFKPPIHKLT